MIAYSFSPEILKEDENAILNSSLFTHQLKKIETNFDTIMRRSSYYITKLLNDRQDELAEDFDEYDLILD